MQPIVSRPDRFLWVWAVLGIFSATVAVYSATLAVPFLYDDPFWITWNPAVHHLLPIANLFSAPANSGVQGRPLLTLSLALNYAVSGEKPWSYHLANIAFHGLAALTLFGVVRRTLERRPAFFPLETDRVIAAFAAALLWAVHPLQTEAVTYVSQRAESLMGLFYLLTLYAFIRSLRSHRPRWWQALSVLACLLGTATKEVMVTAPLLVLAYDRTFAAGSVREALRLRGRFYLGLAAPWIVLGLLMVGLRGRGVGFGLGYDAVSYAAVESFVVVHYGMLALWPFPLVFDYGSELGITLRQVLPWAGVLAVGVAAAGLAFRRRTALGFAAGSFFLILAPTSSLVPVAFQPMAEHRMYLPLAAILAALVAGAWARFGRRTLPFLGAAALAFAGGAFLRNGDYRSAVSIWSDTVLRRPDNPRARLSLGTALWRAQRPAEAAQQFREALRIDPGDFQAREALGRQLIELGRPEEALEEFSRIARPQPDSEALHYDRARALQRLGRTDAAVLEYRAALRLEPDAGSGPVPLEEGLQGEPGRWNVHCGLAAALAARGDLAGANSEFRQALRARPDFAPARAGLESLQSRRPIPPQP